MCDHDISITVIHPSGGLLLATMHNGMRVSRRYFDYTPAEAKSDFLDELHNGARRHYA